VEFIILFKEHFIEKWQNNEARNSDKLSGKGMLRNEDRAVRNTHVRKEI